MKGIQITCNSKVLVLASANMEVNALTKDYNWGELLGKKINVHSLRPDRYNPKKFYAIWQKGEQEEEIVATDVRFSGWAGSSFNIADHLVNLGMSNVTLAAFVSENEQLNEFLDYLNLKGIKVIPLWASNNGITYVFEDENSETSESVVCMQKPAEIDTAVNKEKLMDEEWDVIVSSSTPAKVEVLSLLVDIFEKNPNAIKTLMPSLALIQSEDLEVQSLFHKLISLTTIFQVNDTEAGRYLNLSKKESFQKPINRRQLVIDLAKETQVQVLIVTMGESGSAVVTTDKSNDPVTIEQSAIEPRWEKRSTVGSGDAFHAGFIRIYAQVLDKCSVDCLNLAAKVGSKIASNNLCVWGANMSQDNSKIISPEEFMEIARDA